MYSHDEILGILFDEMQSTNDLINAGAQYSSKELLTKMEGWVAAASDITTVQDLAQLLNQYDINVYPSRQQIYQYEPNGQTAPMTVAVFKNFMDDFDAILPEAQD